MSCGLQSCHHFISFANFERIQTAKKNHLRKNSSNINQLQHGPPATKRTPLALGGMSRRSGEKSLWTAGTSVTETARVFGGNHKLIENGRYMCVYI